MALIAMPRKTRSTFVKPTFAGQMKIIKAGMSTLEKITSAICIGSLLIIVLVLGTVLVTGGTS